MTALTGTTGKGKSHATAAAELKPALGKRPDTPAAERALRELISAKSEVEYGVGLVTATKAEPLVRRAKTLVDLAVQIVRLGRRLAKTGSRGFLEKGCGVTGVTRTRGRCRQTFRSDTVRDQT